MTFEVGELTPEECFWAIQQEIKKANADAAKDETGSESPYSAVLINDIDAITNGFPLLHANKLFAPSLIDLFYVHRLTSVWIGYKEEGHETRDIERAVAARSDYRINLSHSPSNNSLPEEIRRAHKSDSILLPEKEKSGIENLRKALKDAQSSDLKTAVDVYLKKIDARIKEHVPADDIEQAVWLVIDNVTGKDYNRKPRWLWVDNKVLHCSSYTKYQEIMEQKRHTKASTTNAGAANPPSTT